MNLGGKSALRIVGAIHDMTVAAASFFLSFLIVLGFAGTMATPGILEKTALFAVGSGVIFFLSSLNAGSWRYASLPDLTAIVKASSIAVIGYVIIQFLYSRGSGLPRAVPVILFLFMIASLAGPRVIYRLVKEGAVFGLVTGISWPKPGAKQVLIYRMNDIAEAYIRAVRLRNDGDVFIAGIIDDSDQNSSRTLQGQRVLGTSRDLASIKSSMLGKGITLTEIVVADSAISAHDLSLLVDRAVEAGLKITRLPDILHTANIRGAGHLEPKPLEVRDLLGRSEVSLSNFEVTRLLEGKTILLTGAGGSIGAELARQISEFNPKKFIICDASEHFLYSINLELSDSHPELRFIPRIADIRDRDRIRALFDEYRPDIVFHAAALKHVPLAEENVLEVVKTNILGTKNCADAAIEYGVGMFVMISTDKAVNPTNVMGATKRAAEAYCQTLDLKSDRTRFKTVRFGNVLGSNGSVVPRFAAQIAKGGPVTVTHPKIARFFMTIPEAVTLVLQATAHGERQEAERGKILVLDMGEPVLIVELAERMIQLAGLRPGVDIKIEFTGLRPGEKLYEELFDPSEVIEKSDIDGYRAASPRVVDSRVLDRALGELETQAAQENKRQVFALLRTIVPEFHPDEDHAVPELAEVVQLKPRLLLS